MFEFSNPQSVVCNHIPILDGDYPSEGIRNFDKNDKQEAKAIKKDTSTDMNYLDTDFPFYKIHPQGHLKTSNSIQTIHSSNRYKKTRASDLLTTVN